MRTNSKRHAKICSISACEAHAGLASRHGQQYGVARRTVVVCRKLWRATTLLGAWRRVDLANMMACVLSSPECKVGQKRDEGNAEGKAMKQDEVEWTGSLPH